MIIARSGAESKLIISLIIRLWRTLGTQNDEIVLNNVCVSSTPWPWWGSQKVTPQMKWRKVYFFNNTFSVKRTGFCSYFSTWQLATALTYPEAIAEDSLAKGISCWGHEWNEYDWCISLSSPSINNTANRSTESLVALIQRNFFCRYPMRCGRMIEELKKKLGKRSIEFVYKFAG